MWFEQKIDIAMMMVSISPIEYWILQAVQQTPISKNLLYVGIMPGVGFVAGDKRCVGG